MPPPSVTLDCRLLCACGCAYYIDPVTGRYAPPASGDRFSPVAGWLAPPQPFAGGPDRIDACLAPVRTASSSPAAARCRSRSIRPPA